MKKFIQISAIGFLISIILTIVQIVIFYFVDSSFNFDSKVFKIFGYFVLYSIPLSLVNSYFFEYLNDNIKWVKFINYRVFIGVVGSAILTICTVFLIRIIDRVVVNGIDYDAFLANEKLTFYLICLGVSLVISLIFHTLFFYNELQKTKVTEQKVIAGTASAQFDALKNQLDPHFLFNSLNVLGSLIEENPESAQEFTISLSQVYRYVLEQKNKDLVTVDEELKFAKTYMNLLKMRFEDSIQFDFPEASTNPESKVVPLSLQLLLENAVKHNVVNDKKPLHIRIFERNGNLIVQNNLQPKEILKKGSGVGLNNIRQRYNLLSDRKVLINQLDREFEVALPMLTKQVLSMKTEEISNFNNDYIHAKKHVEEMKQFYFNLISYCIVIPFLIFIYFSRTPNAFQWFWFPIFGWGMGLTLHGYKVFVNDGFLGRNWEKRKIEELMKKDKELNR